MKKKLLLLILALAMVLSACGTKPQDTPSEPSGQSADTIETIQPTEETEEETTEETTVPVETEPPVVVELQESWIPVIGGREISARQYFVYDCDSATFLMLSGRADAPVYPASITKLFSAYVALQYIEPSRVVTAGDALDLIDPDSSVAGLQKGDQLTAEQLVAAMMLPSGNDAAYVLATEVGRILAEDPELEPRAAVERFVEQMNVHAEVLGMSGSHFVTPDGIHDENHHVTIADLIIVGRLALKNPVISKYAATVSESISLENGRTLEWKNTNWLLRPDSEYYCEYTVGLKTGFTNAAGSCLLSAFQIGERTLLVGVFGSTDAAARCADTLILLCQLYGIDIPEPPPVAETEPEETTEETVPEETETVPEETEEQTQATDELTVSTEPESSEPSTETGEPSESATEQTPSVDPEPVPDPDPVLEEAA